MNPLILVLHLLLGLAVGLGLAFAHLGAARRAAAALSARQSSAARLLAGFPIRVGLPALALFGLARVSLWALAGGALAFIVGQRIGLARSKAPKPSTQAIMNPVFTLDLLGLEIPDTIVVSLGLTLLVLLVTWLSSRRLRVDDPSMWQVVLEIFVTWISDMIEKLMGEDPKPYVPLIGTLIAWIGLCNLLSAIPLVRPPTADLSTTVALALVVMLAVPGYGIWRHGVRGYLQTYIKPHPLLLPFNLIGELTRTLALAVRLFGNIMSGQMIGGVLLLVAGLLIPIPLVMLGLLTGAIQAYIFGVLAAVYIAAAVQVEDREQQPQPPADAVVGEAAQS